jgi:hypothetical protein
MMAVHHDDDDNQVVAFICPWSPLFSSFFLIATSQACGITFMPLGLIDQIKVLS